MRSGRTVVALSVVTVLGAAIYLTFVYGTPAYIGPVVGTISLAWAILQLTYHYWTGSRAPRGGPSTPGQVRAAARWLAGAVADGWRKEAAKRRITIPAPAAVRWEWAAGGLSPREAENQPFPGAGPPALPGPGQPGRIPTSGLVTELPELYRRLPHGRLVITGEPGSGKTAAMILLLLETLDWREKLAADERTKVPVPVLLTLAGWDPASVPLHEWAAGVLRRDYPALRSPRYGEDAASALIDSGHVALFLDGLDEMPGKARVNALEQLQIGVPGLRIVVTSRSAEYAEAIREAPLEGSAVIELCPVQPDVAAKFLMREQPEHNRAAWRKVADYIRKNPGSVAARAMSDPLTLTMARDAYATGDPADIIDSSPAPTQDSITARLIDQFLAKTYPEERSRRWLGRLARHLDDPGGKGRRDLEWWRLGSMLNPATRILIITLATSVLGAMVCWIILVPPSVIIGLPANLALVPVPNHLMVAVVDGLASGPIAGIIFGSAYATAIIYGKARFEPSKAPLRLRGPRAMARSFQARKHAVRAAWGFLCGLAGGIVYALLNVLGGELHYGFRILDTATLAYIALSGTMFGLAVGISFFLISALEGPSDTGAATPLGLLAESRSRALIQAAVFLPMPTIVFLAGGWILSDLTRGIPDSLSWSLLAGLVMGAITGIVGTVSYVIGFTAWGQWLLLARIALPLTGRLPWRLTGFLQDAYDRGVLRQAGAVYQFRHLTLQTHLSRQ